MVLDLVKIPCYVKLQSPDKSVRVEECKAIIRVHGCSTSRRIFFDAVIDALDVAHPKVGVFLFLSNTASSF